jgi:Tfp pilus assembly protein PilO
VSEQDNLIPFDFEYLNKSYEKKNLFVVVVVVVVVVIASFLYQIRSKQKQGYWRAR